MSSERYCEAELYRVEGELARLDSRAEASDAERSVLAQACFERAIAVTRQQSARSLELRATLSLVRLWQRQGKNCAAMQRLAGIFGAFHEGWDMADLHEAKVLLDSMK
ncbi:hypothetical protein [Cupriavidus necator]